MAEEIGRRVAYELTSNFAKLGSDQVAQQSKAELVAENFASLSRAIMLELRGFNRVVQREFRLTMLPGQNCLILNFESRHALTLKVEVARVRLVLDPPNDLTPKAEAGRASIEFTVFMGNDGFTYQKIASPPKALQECFHNPSSLKGSFAWHAANPSNAHGLRFRQTPHEALPSLPDPPLPGAGGTPLVYTGGVHTDRQESIANFGPPGPLCCAPTPPSPDSTAPTTRSSKSAGTRSSCASTPDGFASPTPPLTPVRAVNNPSPLIRMEPSRLAVR